jgi:hypothetical protein
MRHRTAQISILLLLAVGSGLEGASTLYVNGGPLTVHRNCKLVTET